MPNKLSGYHEEKQVKKVSAKNKIDKKINDFFACIRFGRVDEIKKSLEKGFDVNSTCKEEKGMTPLMFAIDKENLELVKIFLAHPEINVNAVDENGETAIEYAVAGANVCVDVDENEITYGLKKENIVFIETLLNTKKVDINIASKSDSNVLETAVYHGYKEVFDLIVGAEGIKESTLSKALDFAVYSGNKIFAEKLIDFGADIGFLDDESKDKLNELMSGDEVGLERSDHTLVVADEADVNKSSDKENSIALTLVSTDSADDEYTKSETYSASEDDSASLSYEESSVVKVELISASLNLEDFLAE